MRPMSPIGIEHRWILAVPTVRWAMFLIVDQCTGRKHPANTAGAAPLAQAAAWSAKDVGSQFHGSSSVILLAG